MSREVLLCRPRSRVAAMHGTCEYGLVTAALNDPKSKQVAKLDVLPDLTNATMSYLLSLIASRILSRVPGAESFGLTRVDSAV
jgi:hypothetical protein